MSKYSTSRDVVRRRESEGGDVKYKSAHEFFTAEFKKSAERAGKEITHEQAQKEATKIAERVDAKKREGSMS